MAGRCPICNRRLSGRLCPIHKNILGRGASTTVAPSINKNFSNLTTDLDTVVTQATSANTKATANIPVDKTMLWTFYDHGDIDGAVLPLLAALPTGWVFCAGGASGETTGRVQVGTILDPHTDPDPSYIPLYAYYIKYTG